MEGRYGTDQDWMRFFTSRFRFPSVLSQPWNVEIGGVYVKPYFVYLTDGRDLAPSRRSREEV